MNGFRSRLLVVLWDSLTKILLVSWPLILAYNVWIVKQLHALEMRLHDTQSEVQKILSEGPRYTTGDAENLRLRILEQVNERMDGQLTAIAVKLEAIQMTVVRLEERQRSVTLKDK